MENEKKPTIIRLTKEFTFEAAHALEGYDGLCREIHGHSYRLFVTVKGTPCADESNPKFGMVMDFGELKRIVNEQILSRLDHAFVMRRTAESTRVAEQIGWRPGPPPPPTSNGFTFVTFRGIVNPLPRGITTLTISPCFTVASLRVPSPTNCTRNQTSLVVLST